MVVLFSPRFLGDICSWKKDSEGRIVSVLVSFGSFNCNLVNVYAPTNRLERSAFFFLSTSFSFRVLELFLGVILIAMIMFWISFGVMFL